MNGIKDKIIIGLVSALLSGGAVMLTNSMAAADEAELVEERVNKKLEELGREQSERYRLIWEELRYLRQKLDQLQQ